MICVCRKYCCCCFPCCTNKKPKRKNYFFENKITQIITPASSFDDSLLGSDSDWENSPSEAWSPILLSQQNEDSDPDRLNFIPLNHPQHIVICFLSICLFIYFLGGEV